MADTHESDHTFSAVSIISIMVEIGKMMPMMHQYVLLLSLWVFFYTIMIISSFFDAKGNNYKRNIVIFSINSASVLSFRSFALSLNKISCTRQFVSELTFRSFALSLNKIGCTRDWKTKTAYFVLSFHLFALSLQHIINPKKNLCYQEKTEENYCANYATMVLSLSPCYWALSESTYSCYPTK